MSIQGAAEIVSQFKGRGIELMADGDGLKFFPAEAVTPEDVAILRLHKSEILRTLSLQREDQPDDYCKPVEVRPEARKNPKCLRHINATRWLDRPAVNRAGWIRSTCRDCGRFIGYRNTI